MARNPDYYHQIRARGCCVLCRRRFIRADDQRWAHTFCTRMKSGGFTEREIRQAAMAMTEQQLWEGARRKPAGMPSRTGGAPCPR